MRDQSALRELAEDPTSRKKFLRMGGSGVAASLAVFIAACGSSDDDQATTSKPKAAATNTPAPDTSGTEQFGKGDLGIANYALTLEYLETEFYTRAAESGMLKGKVLETAKRFGSEEAKHVEALTALITKAGGKPPSPDAFAKPATAAEVLKAVQPFLVS